MKNSALQNKYICDICQNDYFRKYNESNNINSYINCFEPEKTFLTDKILFNFNSCYYSCKTCEIKGNETHNNCIECKNDFLYELNIKNLKYKNYY